MKKQIEEITEIFKAVEKLDLDEKDKARLLEQIVVMAKMLVGQAVMDRVLGKVTYHLATPPGKM